MAANSAKLTNTDDISLTTHVKFDRDICHVLISAIIPLNGMTIKSHLSLLGLRTTISNRILQVSLLNKQTKESTRLFNTRVLQVSSLSINPIVAQLPNLISSSSRSCLRLHDSLFFVSACSMFELVRGSFVVISGFQATQFGDCDVPKNDQHLCM